jgi:hypothetical protein
MKNKLMIAASFGIMAVFSSCGPQPETKVEVTVNEVTEPTLTVAEINAAQQAWCDALVEIGRLHSTGGDYKAFAEQVLTDAYDYDSGRVFFKPTLTTGDQVFRKTKKGALAYFVGGDPEYPNDNGFALKPWVEVRYDNDERGAEEVMVLGNIGIAMGSVYFKDKEGNEIFVDKTFVFKKGDDGKVRLILHKSALPVM